MYGLTQCVHHRAIGLRKRYAGVIRKECSLLCSDKACMSEGCEVSAQVGLIEFQNVLNITDAQGLVMKQIEDPNAIRVCESF